MAIARSQGASFLDRAAFNVLFAADWMFGKRGTKAQIERWERFEKRLAMRAAGSEEGRVFAVERRSGLTPDEFCERYLLTGVPVVLEGAAADWPAVARWTPSYLAAVCGDDSVEVLDGVHWKVDRADGVSPVETAESRLRVRELIAQAGSGGSMYGAFLEILDRHAELRADLDLTFVEKYGHTNALPWQRNILAKMYVGGPGTSTSLHCAGVSNLYVQVYGRKKWVLIPARFTPYMYLAFSRGLNWQSRVDFRNPDYETCPLYRYVDRYETVLEPGDVLWNPPLVWHGVANVTESIAVSLWWINAMLAFRNQFTLSALTLCGRPNPIAMQLGWSGTQRYGESAFSVHLNR